MLTPNQIENAMRGQFIFANREKKAGELEIEYQRRLKDLHRLHTDESKETMKSLALMVFIGIAELYSLSEDEVTQFLHISDKDYGYYLAHFRRLYSKAIHERERGHLSAEYHSATPYAKVYNKYGLVLNYLKYHDLI